MLKRFKVIGAALENDQIVLTLQYGNQIGKIMIDAKHQYLPQDLYKFPEMLDQLLSEIGQNMLRADIHQMQETVDTMEKYGPNRLEGMG